MRLFAIVRNYRWLIALALGLVIIENVAWILEPSLFGPVLDALIASAQKQPGASIVLPLILWTSAFAINSGVGALRRALDPRIYLRVYADIAGGLARTGREQRLPIGVTAARAGLFRDFITFLQYRVPETLEQGIAIGGAVIGLAFFDSRIALACAGILVPVYFIQRLYAGRVRVLQTEVHDRLETAFDTLQDREPDEVRDYYLEVAKPQQRIANWGAASFGVMRLALLGLFLVVLFVAIGLDNFSTGQLYSIVAYLWTFVTSSEYLPELLESWTDVQDLSHRLQSEESSRLA
ncbi:MAG: ABC transporter six-transmembrane domain-containing protein [Gemmatimonadales bacterium]